MIEVGILKNFDNGTYKAGVQLAGSLTTYFDNVNVAKNIPSAAMVVGNYVIVAIPGGNPRDACVIATWPQGSPGGGMEVHGNEYHDPNFATEAALATHAATAAAHHAVHLKTLADHPLTIIPTMDDAHIPAAITRDAEVFLLQKRGMDEWWKNMDGWTQVTANGGSDSHTLMRLTMVTSANLNGRVCRHTGACRGAPQWDGQRGFTRVWIGSPPADSEIRFYIVHLDESFDPLIDTEEHGGFKIVGGDIYATNADGTTEKATDTGVNLGQGGNRTLEVRGVDANKIEFYVDEVLKVTHTENYPTVHTSNYCYAIEVKNSAAANKKIRVTYCRHTD